MSEQKSTAVKKFPGSSVAVKACALTDTACSPLIDSEATTAAQDPLEQAEATKEKNSQQTSAVEGLKGEEALDAAIGDDDADVDPEVTSGQDDALEESEAKKEKNV